jgi:hypothetical protein
MIGFNHALAGALIGAYLPLPAALPVALASHFVLDALPHYGLPHENRDVSPAWRAIFITDFIATACLIALPASRGRYAMLACGIMAVIPDFVWVIRVIRDRSFDLSNNLSWFTKWHAGIQRYERPWGIWIELPLAAILFYFVWQVR